MKAKQRKRRAERRRSHGGIGDRPRRILDQISYPKVKQGHIVPTTYQRNFAVGGRVAVHVVWHPGCHRMKAENAGTQGPFYRRRRHDGSEIDDVEACLAVKEDLGGPVLAEVAGGAPLDARHKGVLAQFFAVQMLRGPVFFSTVHQIASKVVADGVTPETVSAELLARSGGSIPAVQERALTALDEQRFVSMLGRSQKASSILACMRWRVLRFAAPVVAYSDQPVVVWPVERLAVDESPDRPTLGPLVEGLSGREISRRTGLARDEVALCERSDDRLHPLDVLITEHLPSFCHWDRRWQRPHHQRSHSVLPLLIKVTAWFPNTWRTVRYLVSCSEALRLPLVDVVAKRLTTLRTRERDAVGLREQRQLPKGRLRVMSRIAPIQHFEDRHSLSPQHRTRRRAQTSLMQGHIPLAEQRLDLILRQKGLHDQLTITPSRGDELGSLAPVRLPGRRGTAETPTRHPQRIPRAVLVQPQRFLSSDPHCESPGP